jgi:rhomboid protease GluP
MSPLSRQPVDEVPVYSSRDNLLIDSCSLVLSSKNIAHRIAREPDGCASIYVAAHLQRPAVEQLERYFNENRNWPPQPQAVVAETASGSPPTILLIGALAIFYLVTGPFRLDSPWFASGAVDSRKILYAGEYYRLATGLTLHADPTHLLSNCLVGGFLLHFYLQRNGTGLGLLLLLFAAVTANYLNVLVHGPGHLSVGFSTAVFAIIGIMSTQQVVEQRRPPGIRMIVPFMAGAALLAMLGSSGVRTDLGAHLFGLLSGAAFGLVSGSRLLRSIRRSSFLQTCAFLTAFFALLGCWNLARAV